MAMLTAEKRMHVWYLPHRGDTELKELGLTLVTLFYNDVERLDRMFDLWKSYPDEVKEKVNIIIVDDCSKNSILTHIKQRKKEIDFSLTIYRVKDDLKWNTPGAWNLGITQAPTDWIVNVASDCCFDIENMTKLLTLKPRDRKLYKFYRKRITNNPNPPNLRGGQPHPEVFLQQKEVFLEIGGFDEDFTGARSGGYGIFDNHFTGKFVKMGIHYGVLKGVEMTEYLEDITGGSIQISNNIIKDVVRINKRLSEAKRKGDVPEQDKSGMIRFKWKKVFSTNKDS